MLDKEKGADSRRYSFFEIKGNFFFDLESKNKKTLLLNMGLKNFENNSSYKVAKNKFKKILSKL